MEQTPPTPGAPAMRLSNHDGQLSGVSLALSATQSSLSSWVAVASGIGALVVASVAVVVGFQVFQFQKTDSLTDASHSLAVKVDALSGQNTNLSGKIDELSKSVGSLAGDIRNSTGRVAPSLPTGDISPHVTPPLQPAEPKR